MAACKPSVPSEYLQPDEMTDVLYDYQLADAMAQMSNNDSANVQKYRAAVLKKYGVSEEQFTASLQYYLRHTEQLKTIYENLAQRFNNEAAALGGGTSGNEFAQFSQSGDTTNIWKESMAMVLSPQKPFNVATFALRADSTFHRGDAFMLRFNADFIFQDGVRDGIVVLTARYQNDSIATQLLHVSTTNQYSLSIRDDGRLGVKELRGCFLLPRSQSDGDNLTTLKLWIVSRILLLKMHTPEPKPAAATDSIKARPDSIPPRPTAPQSMQAAPAPQNMPPQLRTR